MSQPTDIIPGSSRLSSAPTVSILFIWALFCCAGKERYVASYGTYLIKQMHKIYTLMTRTRVNAQLAHTEHWKISLSLFFSFSCDF